MPAEGYDNWGVPSLGGEYYGPWPAGPGFPGGLWIDVTPAPAPRDEPAVLVADEHAAAVAARDLGAHHGETRSLVRDARARLEGRAFARADEGGEAVVDLPP